MIKEETILKLSMSTCYYHDLSPEEAVERQVKNQWKYVELSSEHGGVLLERGKPETVGREFRRFSDNVGALIPQGHLWLDCDIAVPEQDLILDQLKRWIDLYQEIGIQYAVLHPGGQNLKKQGYEPKKIHELRVQALQLLVEYIGNNEMILCLENTLGTISDIEGMDDLIKSIDSPKLGICLDTGHLNRSGGSQKDFIHKAKNNLKALHINDNQGGRDIHIMPYGSGTVNWEEVVTALKEIEFSGTFNLELKGEAYCPLAIRDAKMDYLKVLHSIMLK